MKLNQFIVIATLVLSCAFALDLNISNRNPYCFYIDFQAGESYTIQYEVTGYKAEEFRMTIYDAHDQKATPHHIINKEKTANYQLSTIDPKEFKICFQSLDNSGKILQFEFIKNTGNDSAYADDKTLQKTYNDAVVAYYSLNDIYSNLRHSFMKIEMQTKVLESTENKVKWCSIIKMVLMISITTIQIVFLTGLFKDYSPLGI